MEIRISQRQKNGSVKTLVINGDMYMLGQEEGENMGSFILDCEMKMNETGKVRVWFYGEPL